MEKAKIIIDIKFNDGTYIRGKVAHSMEFTPQEHWQLRVYETQEDVFKNNPILWWGVEKIEVVGYIPNVNNGGSEND